MMEIGMAVGGLVGGLFSGALVGLLAFFVWDLVKEGIEDHKKMAIPALFLLSIFGAALTYVVGVIFQNWPLFIGAAVSFINVVRTLFKTDY